MTADGHGALEKAASVLGSGLDEDLTGRNGREKGMAGNV